MTNEEILKKILGDEEPAPTATVDLMSARTVHGHTIGDIIAAETPETRKILSRALIATAIARFGAPDDEGAVKATPSSE